MPLTNTAIANANPPMRARARVAGQALIRNTTHANHGNPHAQAGCRVSAAKQQVELWEHYARPREGNTRITDKKQTQAGFSEHYARARNKKNTPPHCCDGAPNVG